MLSFMEKPKGDGALINAGFFVLSPEVIDFVEGDETIWEQKPLKSLAEQGERWSLDTMIFATHGHARDKKYLNKLWKREMPWKTW